MQLLLADGGSQRIQDCSVASPWPFGLQGRREANSNPSEVNDQL